MVDILFGKFSLKTVIITTLIMLTIVGWSPPVPKNPKDAEKLKQQKQEAQEKASEAQHEANLKHQLNIQSKDVQNRMKKNQELTNNHYKNKSNQCFFLQLFKKKRKR